MRSSLPTTPRFSSARRRSRTPAGTAVSARAVAQGELSRLAEAEATFEKAITIARGDPEHDELVVAEMLREEASVLRTASKGERARTLMTEAQQILVSHLGPQHPRLAELHIDFASLALQRRDLPGARKELARARRSPRHLLRRVPRSRRSMGPRRRSRSARAESPTRRRAIRRRTRS